MLLNEHIENGTESTIKSTIAIRVLFGHQRSRGHTRGGIRSRNRTGIGKRVNGAQVEEVEVVAARGGGLWTTSAGSTASATAGSPPAAAPTACGCRARGVRASTAAHSRTSPCCAPRAPAVSPVSNASATSILDYYSFTLALYTQDRYSRQKGDTPE